MIQILPLFLFVYIVSRRIAPKESETAVVPLVDRLSNSNPFLSDDWAWHCTTPLTLCKKRYATKGMQKLYAKKLIQQKVYKKMHAKKCMQRYAKKGLQKKVCKERFTKVCIKVYQSLLSSVGEASLVCLPLCIHISFRLSNRV